LKKYFVTCDIDAVWPESGEVISIGNYTPKVSRRKNVLHKCPYHWDNFSKLTNDRIYLNEIYTEYLEKFTQKLNVLHRLSYSTRYWEVLIGAWLKLFIHVFFDRLQCVIEAASNYPDAELIRLKKFSSINYPKDSEEFFRATSDEVWNEQITADIFETFTQIQVAEIDINGALDLYKPHNSVNSANLPKITYRFINFFMQKMGSKTRTVFYTQLPLNRMRIFKLIFRWKSLPILIKFWETPISDGIPSREKLDFSEQTDDYFKAALNTFIIDYIPKSFIEDFMYNHNESQNLRNKYSPKVILSSTQHQQNDQFKFWVAICLEHGSKLIILQHGGNYGIGEADAFFEYELRICDKFLTWGWSDPNNEKIALGYSFQLAKNIEDFKTNRDLRKNCILIQCSLPKRSYFLGAWPIGPQSYDYHLQQFAFSKDLNRRVKHNLSIRLPPTDPGWELPQRWKEFDPEIQVIPSQEEFSQVLSSAKIVVCSYNGTTFLQTMKLDIPTIVFFNLDHWRISQYAYPYLMRLKAVGVFFETAADAANQVNQIWDDALVWWHSSNVQDAVIEFLQVFANSDQKTLAEIKKIF
jgi:putative transferase (TIGR04331 family)